MAFTVNSNTLSFSIANTYNSINERLDNISRQIASGKRILSASDDPAGLAQANALKAQYGSFGVVRNNLTFGKSLLEASSSALGSVNSNLSEMRELAVQAAQGTLSTEQRAALQAQFVEYQAQIDASVNGATLFGQNLVSAAAADVSLQTGINAGEQTTVTAVASDGATLGVDTASIDLTSDVNAGAAITAIDAAMASIGTNQATFGAQINRIDSIDANVVNQMENLDSARSRIEDADVAQLTIDLSLLQTQQQLASAMLGVSNALPQSFLTLLR